MLKNNVDSCTTTHHTAPHRMTDRLVNKTVRLSTKQIEQLQEEARRDDRPWTSLVRIAVDEMLEARRHKHGVVAQPGEAVPA